MDKLYKVCLCLNLMYVLSLLCKLLFDKSYNICNRTLHIAPGTESLFICNTVLKKKRQKYKRASNGATFQTEKYC